MSLGGTCRLSEFQSAPVKDAGLVELTSSLRAMVIETH